MTVNGYRSRERPNKRRLYKGVSADMTTVRTVGEKTRADPNVGRDRTIPAS